MTASRTDSEKARLPPWRLVAGFAVLGTLVALLTLAASVYVDNFMLDRYMRTLAEQSSSAGLSDAAIIDQLLERAKQLGLPVQASDIQITRRDGQPHIRIAKYTVETKLMRLDLRMPEASSR